MDWWSDYLTSSPKFFDMFSQNISEKNARKNVSVYRILIDDTPGRGFNILDPLYSDIFDKTG